MLFTPRNLHKLLLYHSPVNVITYISTSSLIRKSFKDGKCFIYLSINVAQYNIRHIILSADRANVIFKKNFSFLKQIRSPPWLSFETSSPLCSTGICRSPHWRKTKNIFFKCFKSCVFVLNFHRLLLRSLTGSFLIQL